MKTRRRYLPAGWYPQSPAEISGLLRQWSETGVGGRVPKGTAIAAVAPHAGWTFSGRYAARAVESLREAETVVVIGGHLPAVYPVLCAPEEAFETPLGDMERDGELAEALGRLVSLEADRVADNTVEVQLPFVKSRFPRARLLWLRAPAGPAAVELGARLAEAARTLGRKVACLGSTDLTHYGPDYDFEPAGRGRDAELWVRNVSDRGFIDALIAMDANLVLERGGEGAACSSGAAAAALSFARASGATRAELLGYATSLEVRRAESFVGYCAVGFYA
jgi:hypothetical protein